ncbi:MAG TPA: hypothetical protein VK050_01830 [Flavobacteriaceae bacterium]|nr:hypothetical protein [Flavobacteriaceae bacterium]
MYLDQEIKSLRANVAHAAIQQPSISAKGVDWHIYHALLVISGICYLLKQSNPKDYQPKFNLLKLVIITTGIIPRGKARAPKEVVPPEQISTKDMLALFSKVENQLENLERLDKNHFYSHHMFGDLNLKKSVKFLGIHSRHHLKIISDIIAASKV